VPHIRLIEPDDADGVLKEEYDAALGRAGKIFNIVQAMSRGPSAAAVDGDVPGDHVRPSSLTRAERELLATVTSQINGCHLLNAGSCRPPCRGRRRGLARHAAHDYRRADLEPPIRALCDFAVKLTTIPSSVGLEDADGLGPWLG
jgi:alkylhydroperoxidase family enzyme